MPTETMLAIAVTTAFTRLTLTRLTLTTTERATPVQSTLTAMVSGSYKRSTLDVVLIYKILQSICAAL